MSCQPAKIMKDLGQALLEGMIDLPGAGEAQASDGAVHHVVVDEAGQRSVAGTAAALRIAAAACHQQPVSFFDPALSHFHPEQFPEGPRWPGQQR